MLNSYKDIRDRIPEEPQWWDEFGVPRYVEFHPSHVADIYARQACLLLIHCQNCSHPFKVAISWKLNPLIDMDVSHDLASWIKSGAIHYGDPPNAGCCAAGPTMNCIDVAVIEYWLRSEHERIRESVADRRASGWRQR